MSFRRDPQLKLKHPGGAEITPATQKQTSCCSCSYKALIYLESAIFHSARDSHWLPIHPLDSKAIGQSVHSLWVRATVFFCLYGTSWVGVRVQVMMLMSKRFTAIPAGEGFVFWGGL